jgi:hemolysin activation/secretion protein
MAFNGRIRRSIKLHTGYLKYFGCFRSEVLGLVVRLECSVLKNNSTIMRLNFALPWGQPGHLRHAIWLSGLLVLLGSFGLDSGASAQTFSLQVEAFEIEGPNPISKRKTRKLLKPFLGKHDSIEPIQEAASALEEALHDKGFAFYLVSVPPQPVNASTIKLKITPFPLKEIRVIEGKHFDEKNILHSVPALKVGESPDTRKVSRALRVANVHPRKRIRLRFASADDNTGVPAQVIVRDTRPASVFLWGNNTGSDRTGEYRVGLGLQHANLFNRDHSVVATWTTSPSSEADVNQYGLSYTVPMYRAGGLLTLVAAKSDIDTGTVAEVFEVAGKGDAYAMQYTQLFPKRGDYQHRLTLGVEDKLFDNDIDFDGRAIGVDVRARPASLKYNGSRRTERGSWEINAGYFHNLSGGEFNDDAAYAASRAGATQSWSSLRLSTSAQINLGDWALSGKLSGQYTNDPLISGEQFGLTGASRVRGFSERGVTSDRGFYGTIELSTPTWRNLQMVLFAEGARGEIVDPLPDQVEEETISSAGIGFRWSWRKILALSAYWATVIDGGSPTGDGTNPDDDDQVHFNIVLRR